MRWLIGVMTALLLATIAAATAGEALSDDAPLPPAASATVALVAPTVASSTSGTSGSPADVTTTAAATPAPAPSSPSPSTASYTAVDVAQPITSDSCWLIMSGQVYDVSAYLRSHPGGSDTINPWCRRESTDAFATEDGEGEHSDKAFALLDQYWIGKLVG